MPRAPRIEFPEATYHVLNRGNYGQDLFTVHRTAEAFEGKLFEAATRFAWIVHAYVVMPNHYHIAMETPRANLSAGMQWLQSSFANRFNRFIGKPGHVFQSRFKSPIVEPGPNLVRVVDYIHLNPVRAGLVGLKDLKKYRWSSFPRFFQPQKQRPECLVDEEWRMYAGYGSGERELRRYWMELAIKREADPEQSKVLDKELCRGWLIGTKEYADQLIDMLEEPVRISKAAKSHRRERESEELWEVCTSRLLSEKGYSDEDLLSAKKSAAWKLELAYKLKKETGVRNGWLAMRLNLGHPCAASKNIAEWKKVQKYKA